MSRAFTREENTENALPDVGERPVSTHRNLVTRSGLEQIEGEIARLKAELESTSDDDDRHHAALLNRDLRYWTARRETAEVTDPPDDAGVVRFGMTVEIEDEDAGRKRWRIVGEDEADPAKGSISHVSPMAVALFGKTVGDLISVNGKEWQIVGIDKA